MRISGKGRGKRWWLLCFAVFRYGLIWYSNGVNTIMMKIHENSKMYKIFVVTGSFQYLVEAKIEEEGRE